MDASTIAAYNAQAHHFAAGMRRCAPETIFAGLPGILHPGAPTADIGCGSGRDTAWLRSLGYRAVGYDGSDGMLREARAAYPGIDVRHDSLPDLTTILGGVYSNVLCSAVLMHLPREDLIAAALALARILVPGGRLYLTYRQSRAASEREDDGRLFTAIPKGKLVLLLESAGFQVLLHSTQADASRPDVRWTMIAAEKSPLHVARGLDRIQSILVQDRKVATYKLALVRGLCAVGRTEPHVVRWGEDEVYVPLRSLAVRWLAYYWPLVNGPDFIAQKHGEQPGSPQPIAFRATLRELAGRYGHDGLYAALRDVEEHPERLRDALRKIAGTIRVGPVAYAGTNGPRVFRYRAGLDVPGAGAGAADGEFGWVAVPMPVWLDLCRFDHWIEDSIVVRWARLTAEMNAAGTVAAYLPLLLDGPGDERDTSEVRAFLRASGSPLECVWSGRPITGRFDVDHALPYSVWGNNDLWNLLPCLPRVNSAKGDALPTLELLRQRRDCIVDYWRMYDGHWSHRFGVQVRGALGCAVGDPGWERAALAGLEETVERLAMTRGLARWQP